MLWNQWPDATGMGGRMGMEYAQERGISAMPRQARLDAPGTLHHVMIRGIEKSKIVDGRKDRLIFLEYMGKTALENDIKIYAFALMTNHAHILLKSGKVGISKYMRRFLTRYAMAYNRRHGIWDILYSSCQAKIKTPQNQIVTQAVKH